MSVFAQPTALYDLVLAGGRIMDPETYRDAIGNIGIDHGRIVEISSEELQGKEVIDVSGLVVAPGFIDLHVHGITNKEQEYQMHDGVTTALELEAGIPYLDAWHAQRRSHALINYGASACWPYSRAEVIPEYLEEFKRLNDQVRQKGWSEANLAMSINIASNYHSLSAGQIPDMLSGIRSDLEDGAIGIGVPIGYVPAASREEVFRIYQFAAKMNVPIFTHVRPGNTIAIQQAISDAAVTGAPLHIVHVNSMALGEIGLAIEMMHDARSRGLDITTELYPYTAGSTRIESPRFDGDWETDQGITYKDLQWVATGERLTEETFAKYRKEGGWVIIHKMKPEWIRLGVVSEGTIIASDGAQYSPGAHPRTAGTFARVLGKYVREEKALSLLEALRKMTLLPAQRLEIVAPSMRFKGRLQVGCDADITVFDAGSVIDKATYEDGLAFSQGIRYVMVNGVLVVKNAETVADVYPGQPVYGKYKK